MSTGCDHEISEGRRGAPRDVRTARTHGSFGSAAVRSVTVNFQALADLERVAIKVTDISGARWGGDDFYFGSEHLQSGQNTLHFLFCGKSLEFDHYSRVCCRRG